MLTVNHNRYIVNVVRISIRMYGRTDRQNGGLGQLGSEWHRNENGGCMRRHNENDVTMTIAGLWRYGNWRHVASGCTTLVIIIITPTPTVNFCHPSELYLLSVKNNNNNNNNNQDDIYGAVVMACNCESSPGSFDECRISARWPPSHRPNQPTWDVSPLIGCYHSHPPSPFIITEPESWYSFYSPTEGGRLSRPRHCSKGVQPMPKAVYRSGFCDKYNCLQWHSILGSLTPQ